MKGIIWYLKGEYGSFRPYDTTTIIDTYLFPPKTAVIGMIGAACGWVEDDLVKYYEKIKVGIEIKHSDNLFSDLVKIWKVVGAKKQTKWLYFPEEKVYTFDKLREKIPSPVLREIYVVIKRFLYQPEFTIYLTTFNENKLMDVIENALKDPVYPITLGDSDSLFYPKNLNYIEIVPEVLRIKSRKFRCLLSSEMVRKAGGIEYTGETAFTIYPRANTMPISFGKNRKDLKTEAIICFKGEIKLKNEIEAYEFKGRAVYLF